MSTTFIYDEFHSVAVFNIPHKDVLFSSYHCYVVVSHFINISFFQNNAFKNIFNANNTTVSIIDLLLKYWLDRDKRF